MKIAEILCKAGADCNVSLESSFPRLLDYAVENSDKKMIELLKQHGAKSSKKV